MAYSAADLAGLVDRFGDDVIQLVCFHGRSSRRYWEYRSMTDTGPDNEPVDRIAEVERLTALEPNDYEAETLGSTSSTGGCRIAIVSPNDTRNRRSTLATEYRSWPQTADGGEDAGGCRRICFSTALANL
jgi:hypothetical protein